MKLYRCLFLACVFISSVSVAEVGAESYATLRADYQTLSHSSQMQRQRLNWERLLKRFDHFISLNPLSADLDRALFLQARTWHGLANASGRKDDAAEAVSRYAAMADSFPDSRLSDDALFHAGQLAEFRLADEQQAYRYYQQLVTHFPVADMVRDARKRLSVLPQPAAATPVKEQPEQQNYHTIGESPRLENIRFWSGPEYTRVVLDLTAPVVSKPHLLKGGSPRLYFDLIYTHPGDKLEAVTAIRNGLVKQVRANLFDEQRTRVVIDLNKVTEYKLTSLENPYRLVIDILGEPQKVALTSTDITPGLKVRQDDSIASILDTSADRMPNLHVPQNKPGDGIRLIVVDAGHGGRDPGAIGPNNVYEKNVTLAMAKALARALQQQMGVEVLLTRSDDRYLELRERTAYANRVEADLFISLHVNASPRGKAYGVETYFLNLSKNNQAAEVAARENGTTLQEVGNLEAILFDLMANAKINESSRLAAEVQQSMVNGLRPHYSHIKDLGVKQGPFHVLLGATMPSVLIEAAFISHPREEKRLTTAAYQQSVANAVVKGVQRYAKSLEQVARR